MGSPSAWPYFLYGSPEGSCYHQCVAETRFDWDPVKDRENEAKHGVSSEEAQFAFDPRRVIAEDLSHGTLENRYCCFGLVGDGILTVRFTYREGVIRIFGAALAGFAAGGLLFGGKTATAIDNPPKANHVVLFEPKDLDGQTLVVMLQEDAVTDGLKRIKSSFGERVDIPEFDEQPERLDKKEFQSLGAFEVRGSSEHPLPEARAGQALVVVAVPAGGGLDAAKAGKKSSLYGVIVEGRRVPAVTPPSGAPHALLGLPRVRDGLAEQIRRGHGITWKKALVLLLKATPNPK